MHLVQNRSLSLTSILIISTVQIGMTLVRAAVVLAVWPWRQLSWRGRAIAGAVLAAAVASNWLLVNVGAIPLAVVFLTAAGVAWQRRRTRARRSPLGQAARRAVGGRTVLLLTSMAAEHVPPFEMASMLTAARDDGWAREVAEIRAAVEALASTSQVAHLVWVQELRRAETAQGVWRPTWMGGPPALTHTQPPPADTTTGGAR